MGILCVFCVYDTIGNRCFEKTSFPKSRTFLRYKIFNRDVINLSFCLFEDATDYHDLRRINLKVLFQ